MTRRRGRGRTQAAAHPAPAEAPKSRRRPRVPGAKPPIESKGAKPPIESKGAKPPLEPKAARTPGPRDPAPVPSPSGVVVLVTGFEPFGGESTNPSWEICERLPRRIGHARIETCRVPCEFRRAIEVVAEAIERSKPAIVLCLGQAGGRSRMSIERIGINLDDARIADNAGARPVDEPVAVSGPAAYFATVPVKAMEQAMREAGVPVEVSSSAGTFVCNHLLYGVLHFIAASRREVRAGFIHVPYSEGQVLDKPDDPSLSVESMARGVEAALVAALG